MPNSNKVRRNWTEDETILAYYYYCQIPFGKINHSNPMIVEIANLIGRTPSAVSFKMGNLAHFDPTLRARNVNGLSNASRLDEEVFNRFQNNWEELSIRAAQIEAQLSQQTNTIPISGVSLPVGGTVTREVRTRLNQQFFREAVLTSYGNRCCITGLAVQPLLVASHIKPWAVSDPNKERTNPRNGLCLNALHDKAFDRGLITVLPDYTVRVSSKLKIMPASTEIEWLLSCDGQEISRPEKFAPSKEFLEYHNDMIFEKQDGF